jgi:hypothetical protein
MVAIALALALNVDALFLFKSLMRDSSLSENIVSRVDVHALQKSWESVKAADTANAESARQHVVVEDVGWSEITSWKTASRLPDAGPWPARSPLHEKRSTCLSPRAASIEDLITMTNQVPASTLIPIELDPKELSSLSLPEFVDKLQATIRSPKGLAI